MDTLKIKYDMDADVVEIEGIKYAGDVFRQLGMLMPEGQLFRLVQREHGTLYIERIDAARLKD